jgi:hypothetical protein
MGEREREDIDDVEVTVMRVSDGGRGRGRLGF